MAKVTSQRINATDDLTKKAKQLSALLETTYGEAGDHFRSMGYSLQDDYLWACADLADQCLEHAAQLAEATR